MAALLDDQAQAMNGVFRRYSDYRWHSQQETALRAQLYAARCPSSAPARWSLQPTPCCSWSGYERAVTAPRRSRLARCRRHALGGASLGHAYRREAASGSRAAHVDQVGLHVHDRSPDTQQRAAGRHGRRVNTSSCTSGRTSSAESWQGVQKLHDRLPAGLGGAGEDASGAIVKNGLMQ